MKIFEILVNVLDKKTRSQCQEWKPYARGKSLQLILDNISGHRLNLQTKSEVELGILEHNFYAFENDENQKLIFSAIVVAIFDIELIEQCDDNISLDNSGKTITDKCFSNLAFCHLNKNFSDILITSDDLERGKKCLQNKPRLSRIFNGISEKNIIITEDKLNAELIMQSFTIYRIASSNIDSLKKGINLTLQMK